MEDRLSTYHTLAVIEAVDYYGPRIAELYLKD